MKIIGCCRALRLSSFFILLTVRLTGLGSNRSSISLHQHCPSRHQRDASSKGPPKIPPNPPHAEQAGLTAVCALPQEGDIAQPLRFGPEASFTTRTLIVSALVMSACSAANSFLPLSPNSPSHSICQSCQQINPRLPATHSPLSPQQAQTPAGESGMHAINVTPDSNVHCVSCPHPHQRYC